MCIAARSVRGPLAWHISILLLKFYFAPCVPMASGPPDFSTTRMQELADKAVKEKAGVISRRLRDEQLHITCRSHTPFDSDNSGLFVFLRCAMRSLRYLGVETRTGEYSSAACAASTSKLGFEWRIQSTEGLRCETVTPSCKNAIRQGVPIVLYILINIKTT